MFHIFVVAFLVVAIYCRFCLIKARKKLSTEDKAKLLDVSSRAWQYVILLGLFGATLLLGHLSTPITESIAIRGLFALLGVLALLAFLAFGIIFRVSNYKRLKALELDKSYLKTYTIYNTILYIDIFIFLIGTILFVKFHLIS